MSRHLIAFAAGLSLVAALGLTMPASAADLDYGYAPEAGSPYDDPRYADIYRHPDPRVRGDDRYGDADRYSYKQERDLDPDYGRRDYGYKGDYGYRADDKAYQYRDHGPRRDYGYDEGYDRQRDYAGRDDYYDRRDGGYLPPVAPRFSGERLADYYRGYGLDERRARGECESQQLIRHRLVRDGWHEFEPIRLGDDIAKFKATARDGRRFVVKLDRCSGEIVDLRRIRWRGDYAWKNIK